MSMHMDEVLAWIDEHLQVEHETLRLMSSDVEGLDYKTKWLELRERIHEPLKRRAVRYRRNIPLPAFQVETYKSILPQLVKRTLFVVMACEHPEWGRVYGAVVGHERVDIEQERLYYSYLWVFREIGGRFGLSSWYGMDDGYHEYLEHDRVVDHAGLRWIQHLGLGESLHGTLGQLLEVRACVSPWEGDLKELSHYRFYASHAQSH